MDRLSLKLTLPLAIIAAAAIIGLVLYKTRDQPEARQQAQAISNQNDIPASQSSDDQEDKTVQPDINTQEFKLTSSNVSCSSSTVNGVTSNSCTGNIRVIPRAQADMEPGLYKINEQTKLLQNGTVQDINSLQQLSQQQTTVRLKLTAGSSDTLAEISY